MKAQFEKEQSESGEFRFASGFPQMDRRRTQPSPGVIIFTSRMRVRGQAALSFSES